MNEFRDVFATFRKIELFENKALPYREVLVE